ncbi:long-chain fatty acid--CoA ligase [Hapalosiphon sp. MRB220]|nr:long-chain fatty acid--CoA ligase [Hapalosiphon sp. MRB220]
MLLSHKIYRAPPNSGKVILGRSIPSLLDEACLIHSNSHALNQWIEGNWQSLSNQEFRVAAQELAMGLLRLELNKGERVALLMHSDINFCIADMGSLLAGLVNVPIDLTQTIEHILFILQHAEVKALFISNIELLYQIIPYLWKAPELKMVIVADVPNDWHVRRQQLTSQQSLNEQSNTLKYEIEEIPSNVCLFIPEFPSQELLDNLFAKFPECIQLFTLKEIRRIGQNFNYEDSKKFGSLLAANDLATLIYIPGINGEPQGVMLTHENLSANTLAMFTGIPNLKFGAQEIVLSFLPLTHVFARVLLYGHINYGHSVYFSNPTQVTKHLREVRPTIFATVPLLLEKIYSKILEQRNKTSQKLKLNLHNLPEQRLANSKGVKTKKLKLLSPVSYSILNWAFNFAQKYELGQKRQLRHTLMLQLANRLVFSQWRAVFGGRLKYLISGGAALKAEIANLFAAAGMRVLQGYGLTETSSALACNRGKFNRAGTVGVAIAGVEIAIAQDGEILTRSPYITQGYYKNPDATQQLIDRDGWLHTGDLGEFTSEGFLKITGLKKSRFKLSTGKYVTPLPIESKLKTSPFVANAVAVGSERKFCAMLIFPNLDALQSYASSIGISQEDVSNVKRGDTVGEDEAENVKRGDTVGEDEAENVRRGDAVRENSLVSSFTASSRPNVPASPRPNVPVSSFPPSLPQFLPEALLKHPCIIALYQALMDEANCHLPYWSTVKRFQLINATPTIENGMLMLNQQVNRTKVAEIFAQEIDDIYKDKQRKEGYKGDGEMHRREDTEIDISSCPVIPTVSCPAFAKSLNS